YHVANEQGRPQGSVVNDIIAAFPSFDIVQTVANAQKPGTFTRIKSNRHLGIKAEDLDVLCPPYTLPFVLGVDARIRLPDGTTPDAHPIILDTFAFLTSYVV